LPVVRLARAKELFQPLGPDPSDGQQQLKRVGRVYACLDKAVQDVGRESLPTLDQAIRDPVGLVEAE
jgi:hypothetical protein